LRGDLNNTTDFDLSGLSFEYFASEQIRLTLRSDNPQASAVRI